MKPPIKIEDKVRAFLAFVDADEALDPDHVTLSDDEVDRQLAAAGFDVASETTKGEAEHAAAVARLAETKSSPGKPSVHVADQVRGLLAYVDGDPNEAADEDANLTDEELDRKLAAAGFDVEAVTAEAQAEHEAAVASLQTGSRVAAKASPARPESRPESPSNVVPIKRGLRTRWIVAFAAAAAVAALLGSEGGAIVAWYEAPHSEHDHWTASDPYTFAREKREDAAKAAARGEWARCLELLDLAKAADPEGDEAAAVQRMRTEAEGKLGRGGDASGVAEGGAR